MDEYSRGFMDKCAEHGVSPGLLYKIAKGNTGPGFAAISSFDPESKRHVDIPGIPGRSDPAWKTGNGTRIGGPMGRFYRNMDPRIPVGEIFFRRANQDGKGEVINIPGNPKWTYSDVTNVAHHISKRLPGVRTPEADIARGIGAHVMGHRLGIGDHYGTYDINRGMDERLGALLFNERNMEDTQPGSLQKYKFINPGYNKIFY